MIAVIVLAGAALACTLVAPASPTAPVATASSRPATVTAAPPTAPTPATATVGVAATEPTAPPLEAAALDAYAWDDRSPFLAGLAPDEQPVLGELPGATVYHLALSIAPGLTRVAGREAVRYTNQEDVTLDAVAFRLYPNLLGGRLNVTGLMVDGAPVSVKLDQEDSVLWVNLPAPLAPGGSVVIDLTFDVRVPTRLERNYGVLAAADGVLALAHAFPYVAVYDDTGWNIELPSEQGDLTYGDASFFIVRVQAPPGLVVAAGGTVIADDTTGEVQSLTFALGPARDFYLAASVAYQATTLEAGPTTLRVYAPPALAPAAQSVIDDAAAALRAYSTRYAPYPYTDLDFVATPTLALGIEYPGIIALTKDMLDPAGGEARLLEGVTAHEAGHQWFYNLVGNDQLDEPWLDESLAQWATLQYYADTGGPDAARGFRDSLAGRWSRVGNTDIPIGLPVVDYQDEAYSANVYGRGPLFFEALAQALGQPAFDELLARYVRTYRWGIATPAGLHELADDVCGCELDTLFSDWGAE